MNREENEPYFPVGSVFPYYGDSIDWVTLRGCKVDRAYFNRYIRFSEQEAGLMAVLGDGSWGLITSQLLTRLLQQQVSMVRIHMVTIAVIGIIQTCIVMYIKSRMLILGSLMRG
nr:hypothetical protein LKV13_04685 [Borrelia sp. BU AG58]